MSEVEYIYDKDGNVIGHRVHDEIVLAGLCINSDPALPPWVLDIKNPTPPSPMWNAARYAK